MNQIQQEKNGSDRQNNNPEQSIFRKFFLNILISGFLILVYYYSSTYFGSISTNIINKNSISFAFNFTLLIYTTLAILAGPMHALIAGFLGELFFQLGFYEDIYLSWILVISLFGFISALYKYKPLRFHKGKNVYYNFLILIVSSIISMSLLIMLGTISPISSINSDPSVIGLNFLLESLVSITFIIPFLLILYDKLLATKERHIYNLLLTHHPLSQSDHTFYLKFGRTYIYFCTRCSGFILGALFTTFLSDLLGSILGIVITPEIAIIICILLPIPGLVDWGLQRLLIRKANTKSRLLTGFIIGIALYMLSYADEYYFLMLGIVIFYFSIFGLLMYMGHRKEMKKFKEQMEESEYYTERVINEGMSEKNERRTKDD